jgi:ABC-type histidine transport system ATPase subunit
MLLDLKLLAEIRSQLRSVIYLTYMRTDIWYMVSVLSQVICEPSHLLTVTVKHILRYDLRYTSSRGI